jgi:hypothetical protein
MIRRRFASGLASLVAREALASLINIVEQNVAGLMVGGRVSTDQERRVLLIGPLEKRSASAHNSSVNRARRLRGEVAAASLKPVISHGGYSYMQHVSAVK